MSVIDPCDWCIDDPASDEDRPPLMDEPDPPMDELLPLMEEPLLP